MDTKIHGGRIHMRMQSNRFKAAAFWSRCVIAYVRTDAHREELILARFILHILKKLNRINVRQKSRKHSSSHGNHLAKVVIADN